MNNNRRRRKDEDRWTLLAPRFKLLQRLDRDDEIEKVTGISRERAARES
jgi:hypothetical protein